MNIILTVVRYFVNNASDTTDGFLCIVAVEDIILYVPTKADCRSVSGRFSFCGRSYRVK